MGGIIVAITTLQFILAMIMWEDSALNALRVQHIVLELVGYLSATVFLWFVSVNEFVPLAYEWLLISLPSSERNYIGKNSNPEGTEHLPISAFDF